jgi:hypothetical protein
MQVVPELDMWAELVCQGNSAKELMGQSAKKFGN